MKQVLGMMEKILGDPRAMRIKDLLSLLERDHSASLIDLGSHKGEIASRCAQRIGANRVLGVEMVDKFAEEAERRGVEILRADLEEGVPVGNNLFDVVISDQVIEHVANIDTFVKEIFRILKPGGYAVISTENLSSWHNIFALILGFRPFSLDYSTEVCIGNPLSHRNKERLGQEFRYHVKVPTRRSFKELFEIHGFEVEKIIGSGYYPLPWFIQKPFSRIDPGHAKFITVKVRKKLNENLS